MGKLEFIYKRNEFKFKEQIALSLFKTQGRWVVCFLNYHVVLSSEFLLLTNKRKTLPMARSISNGLFDSHCGLFHYTMSHIFFLCQLQRLKKKNLVAIFYIGYKKSIAPQGVSLAPQSLSGVPAIFHHWQLDISPLVFHRHSRLSMYKAELYVVQSS